MQGGVGGGNGAEDPLGEPWVARCSRGGNRFSGKGQACELSAHHVQPPELRAFILGNNVGFIICENGGGKKKREKKTRVSHALNPAQVGTICQP